MKEVDIFDATIHKVPYNSFGKTLLADGVAYPEKFGGNCVFQCQSFVDSLLSHGYSGDISFITAKEKPHWVTLCKDGASGDTLFFDPFLLHAGAINLTKLKETGNVRVPAYPLGETGSYIEVISLGENMIRSSLNVFRGKYRSVLEYTFDLGTKHLELPPKDYQTLAGLRQNKLEMGVLDGQGDVHRMYCYPNNGQKSIVTVGEKGVCEVKNPEAFLKKVEEIAAVLKTDVETLLKFWQDGLIKYNQRQLEIQRHETPAN